MKKWMAGSLSAVLCLTFPVMASLAYAPTDSDFGNVWGSTGCEITTDADGNARLVFDAESDWGARLSYMEPVKLDGLEITLTDVEIEEGAAPTLVISNEQGQWVDSDMPTFIHALRNSDTLGAVENGFLLAKSVMDDAQPRMINETAFTSPMTPEMVISFNQKDESTWTYTVNGQDFDFDASHLSSLADLDNVYLNFGNWTQKHYSTSFVVANIQEERPATTTTEAPTTTTETPPTTTQADEAPESSADEPSGSAGGGEESAPVDTDQGSANANVVAYVILAVVVLACIGVGVFIVIKYVVKKPTDTPPDNTAGTKPEE